MAPPPTSLKIGILLLGTGVQLLDLAAIDILGMMDKFYLREVNLPEEMVAKGLDIEYYYITEEVSENGDANGHGHGGEKGVRLHDLTAGAKVAATVCCFASCFRCWLFLVEVVKLMITGLVKSAHPPNLPTPNAPIHPRPHAPLPPLRHRLRLPGQTSRLSDPASLSDCLRRHPARSGIGPHEEHDRHRAPGSSARVERTVSGGAVCG